MTSPQRPTSRLVMIAVCGNCEAASAPAVLDELRATIRGCDHGVLVSTGCMLGPLACAARPCGPGTMAMLRPCSVDLVANGPTYWIGPINGRNDAWGRPFSRN